MTASSCCRVTGECVVRRRAGGVHGCGGHCGSVSAFGGGGGGGVCVWTDGWMDEGKLEWWRREEGRGRGVWWFDDRGETVNREQGGGMTRLTGALIGK